VSEFLVYLRKLVDERRRHPGDPEADVLTRLLQGDADGALSESELLHNCIFLLNAGHETTTNLIGNGLRALLRHRGELERLVAELAEQHRRGRSLPIGTTNLDAARPVTWSLTRIAASGSPRARTLIHDVLLASASIPGVFPPVMIDVEADGRRFEEMHVDGGVTSQVFVYPTGLDWSRVKQRLAVEGPPALYVINNNRALLAWETAPRRVLPILLRSVDSLIRTQGIGDLAQIYLLAQRDGLRFNLAYIPASFKEQPQEKSDPVYMRKLFDLGFERARNGYPWTSGPRLDR